MATIKGIVEKRSGRAGAWKVTTSEEGWLVLWHYGTVMLRWKDDGSGEPGYIGEGYGSVSDQNGMNIAFRTLGMPYYFSRRGGSHIRRTDGQ